MRTWTTRQENAYASGSPKVRVKVEIEDDSGSMQDWTDLLGGVAVVSMSWKENLKQRQMDGEVRVNWKSGPNNNVSPRVSGKRYSGYLGQFRRIDGYVKVCPPAADPDDYTWIHVFRGKIDDWNLAQPIGVIKWRDEVGSDLSRDFVIETTEYGNDSGTKDIEDVIADLLTDFSTTSQTLTTPTASSLQVRAYEQKKMPLYDAISTIARAVGWDVRPLYDGTTDWDLTLYEPTRTGASSAHTFPASAYADVGEFREDGSQIRNAVRVWYVDSSTQEDDDLDARTYLERTDETSPANDWTGSAVASSSIDDYGWAFMELAEEGTDLLRDSTAAAALADAALADLSQPRLQAKIELTYLWWPVEINDVYTFTADGDRFDTDTDMAVEGYSHQAGDGRYSTTLDLIDAPTLDRTGYLQREARPGVAPSPEEAAIAAPDLTVVGGYAKNFLSWDWPQHSQQQPDRIMIYRGNSSGFTANSTSLVAESRSTEWVDTEVVPGNTYYYLARWKTNSRNYSEHSTEDSATPAKWTEGTFLDLSVSTTSLQAQITSNDNDISTLQSDLNTAESDIATNASDISSNDTDIATNASDISALEALIPTKGASAYVGTDKTDVANGDAVAFDTEEYDSASGYNTSLWEYTAQKKAVHAVSATVRLEGHEGMSYAYLSVVRNSTIFADGVKFHPIDGNTDPVSCTVTAYVPMDSADDVHIELYHDSGATTEPTVKADVSRFEIQETLRHHGQDMTDLTPLQNRLDEWGIRHFGADELVELRNPKWTGPRHVLPPRGDLDEIWMTVCLADVLRDAWDGPVDVVSGYRPLAYNRLVGSKDTSEHIRFKALDLRPVNEDIVEFWLAAECVARTARMLDVTVGLGLYDTFIHIDVGSSKGSRTWDERS